MVGLAVPAALEFHHREVVMTFSPFEFGCKFTVFYFTMGMLGSLMAVWALPGSYTALPYVRKVKGQWLIHWAVAARLLSGGIMGCVADRNGVNALFAGFFCWHVLKWLSEEGWKHMQSRLDSFFKTFLGKD